jgi:hypothetical protein
MLDQRIRRTRDIVHNRLPGRVTGHGAVAVTQGTGARSPRARCPAAVARARWSARWALVSSRGASVAVASARSASSPVAPEGAAWSRPAAALCVSVEAISCALFPAVRDRSRTRVRMAPPAAWIRRRGRRDPPHRLGQETRVGRVGDGGRNHRRIGTYPAGAQQLGLGALASRVSFTPVHHGRATAGGQLHQRGRMRHPASRLMRPNRRQVIESDTSRHVGCHELGTTVRGFLPRLWDHSVASNGTTWRVVSGWSSSVRFGSLQVDQLGGPAGWRSGRFRW